MHFIVLCCYVELNRVELQFVEAVYFQNDQNGCYFSDVGRVQVSVPTTRPVHHHQQPSLQQTADETEWPWWDRGGCWECRENLHVDGVRGDALRRPDCNRDVDDAQRRLVCSRLVVQLTVTINNSSLICLSK